MDLSDTLFTDWTPSAYPDYVKNAPLVARSRLMRGVLMMPGPIAQAQADGLPQLVPLIVYYGARPDEIRAKLGRPVWRALHHATEFTNGMRVRLHLESAGTISWPDLVAVPPKWIRSVYRFAVRSGFAPDELAALVWAAPKVATAAELRHMLNLYADARQMGVRINPAWSKKRLVREHDAAALGQTLVDASPMQWRAPFTITVDGYQIRLLISDHDFAQEAALQKHCILSYASVARSGQYHAFAVSGPERATLGTRDMRCVHQLYGRRNSRVSPACRAACLSALRAFRKTLHQGKASQ